MSHLNHKRLRGRKFRLELLESRELLRAVGLPAHGAAEVSPLVRAHRETIKASLSGLGSVIPITSSTGTLSAESSGTATVLGAVTLLSSDSYSVNKHHSLKYSNGKGALANLSGDSIDVTFTGSGRVQGASIFTFSVRGPITDGTGEFGGATGSFTAKGSFDSATDAFSINLKVTLKHT